MEKGKGGLFDFGDSLNASCQLPTAKSLLLTVLCSLLTVLCNAQPGTWQTHFSYRSAQSVGVIGQNVYAATRNGFFRYDKTTGETHLLTRADGLSEVSISRILALPSQSRLLLAYRSGNIDFLSVSPTGEPGEVLNINTIATAERVPIGFRGINHIHHLANTAYLSTDFGLVQFDLSRNEIRNTYFAPLTNGLPTPVYQSTILGENLHILTAQLPGIRSIRLTPTTNLADPANWQPSPVNTTDGRLLSPNQLVALSPNLYASVNTAGGNAPAGGVYERGGAWSLTLPSAGRAGVFRVEGGISTFVQNNAGESVLTLPGSVSFTGPLLQTPREVVADNPRAWVADTTTGLLEAANGSFRRVSPAGPYADSFQNLFAYPNRLVALPGDRLTNRNLPATQPESEQYDVSAGRWQSDPLASLGQPFNSATYLSGDGRLYLGSYGGGLWTQTEGQPLARVNLPVAISPLVTALATDADGNLWIGASPPFGAGASLHLRRPNGQFSSFPRLGNVPIAQIVPDDFGNLWLRLTFGSLLVFNPQTGQQRYFSTAPGDGNLPGNTITALAKDRNGLIWVGTDRGVTVFDDPGRALTGNVSANAPIFERRRLLGTETITAMAVDGGNRKWIATESALYRFGPDGTTLENRFAPADSPLPSTDINALAIEPLSGRVFISTSGGLVSYGGVATEPADALTGITIFPNPVRPDFGGLVSVRGLTDNAVVKFLDAAGQLVHETRAQGGSASWNLVDYRGRSAQTGVYLVVVVRADGQEGIAGKLAVVR